MADCERSALGERFWSKVDLNGPASAHRPDLGSCWIWTAARNKNGYGVYWFAGRMVLAYHLPLGPVADGVERDHLCRVRECVRPDHLEAVTHQVNMSRSEPATRDRCPWDHAYTPENTHVVKATGARQCRTCSCVRSYEARLRRGEIKGDVMGRWDYEVSKKIISQDPSFESLIMAAMRKADTPNSQLLRQAFPEVWAELDARYNAPGGLLPSESA